MASTLGSPSSGGSLTSLDPSPPPSTAKEPMPPPDSTKSAQPPSDASSDLSELSSDGQDSGRDAPSDILSDDDDDDDGDSSTDQPFTPSSSKQSARKKTSGKSSTSRKPNPSRPKGQSPSKPSAPKSKPTSSRAAVYSATHNSIRRPRQKSSSSSPSNGGGPSGPPHSSTSSYGSAAIPLSASLADESDDEESSRRSSRRNKRSAIVPGGMWDWATRKSTRPSVTKKDSARSQRGEGESSHESPAMDKFSPSRESEVDDRPTDPLEAAGGPPLSAAVRVSSNTLEDEEDVKPDINVLQSNTTYQASAPAGYEPDGSAAASTRTSPGLPLASVSNPRLLSTKPHPAGHRRSNSVLSAALGPPNARTENVDAMDLDTLPVSALPKSTRTSPASPLNSNSNSLDILAQFAAALNEANPTSVDSGLDEEDLPQTNVTTGNAVSSEAGEDAEEDEEDEDAAGIGRELEEDDQVEDEERVPKTRRRGNIADDAGKVPNGKPTADVEDDLDDTVERDLEARLDGDKDPDAADDSDQESVTGSLARQAPADEDGDQAAQDVEAAEMEAEQEIENEIQPLQRVEALEILTAMELKFALLRERIYQDKMRDISREEKSLLEGNHPEYLYLLSELQRRKDRKLDLASKRLEREKEFATHKRKAEERSAWASWHEVKDDVRDELVAEGNAKRRKLEREKRSIDCPKITQSPPRMPHPRLSAPSSPKSVKRTIKMHTTRYSSTPSLDHPRGAPVLAPLSQNELAMDIEILTGRGGRRHASHYHPPATMNNNALPSMGHQHSHYAPPPPPQASYGPPSGYAQPPGSLMPNYSQQQHGPLGPRYTQPVGYGHAADPNVVYSHPPQPQQHTPPGYEVGYDPYNAGGPPSGSMQHYTLAPPSGPHPQYTPHPSSQPPPPQHHAYAPHPQPPPQHAQHSHPLHPQYQPLHQPQPQYHASRLPPREPSPPLGGGGVYQRNVWRGPLGDPNGGGPREKVVIDLTRTTPDVDGPPPPRLGGPTPRPSSSHVKQEQRDDRPSSSSGRERLPSLASQIPLVAPLDPRSSPVLAPFSGSTTPRPPSTLPHPASSPFPSSVPRSQQLPMLASPATVVASQGFLVLAPPRSTGTPSSSAAHRHSQSPTIQKRPATPLGLPPFSPAPPPHVAAERS